MELILISWLGLVPFVLLYGAYEGPKVFWVWTGGFFLAISWIVTIIRSQKITITKPGRWFLLWIGILFISSVLGVHPWESIIGGSYRHQGVLLFFTLFLIGETITRFSVSRKQLLGSIIGAGVLGESVLVMAQKSLHTAVRPPGTLGEPNAVAGYLAIGLLWVWTLPKFQNWVRIVFYGLVVAGIVATGSRTGLITAGIVTMGVGLRMMLKNRHNLIFITCILGGLLVAGISGYVTIRVITITRPQSHYENRTEFWNMGIKELKKRPILGYGAESLETVYDRAYRAKSFPLADFMIDRTHNIFLDIALWSGIIGLVVFILWLSIIAFNLIKTHDYRRAFVFLAWIVFASFQPVGVVHWILLLMLVTLV